MTKRTDITADYARQLFDYDPKTGVLTWKPRTPDMFKDNSRRTAAQECLSWNTRFSGKDAGWVKPSGYRMVCIEYVQYRAHHVIWLMVTGKWPDDQLDHRNGVRSKNNFSNLREATNAQNHQNMKTRADNTSGFTGVSWHGQVHKWVAYINHAGKRSSLGLFERAEDAHKAYLDAKLRLHSFQPVPRE